MMEAQNLSRLQQGQTPLLGGENPQIHDSDFSGVNPKNFAAATPHPLAVGATPLPGSTPALTGATPARAIAGAAPDSLSTQKSHNINGLSVPQASCSAHWLNQT
jgi:pre-mRNA-splicing factor CDC5/CEF1